MRVKPWNAVEPWFLSFRMVCEVIYYMPDSSWRERPVPRTMHLTASVSPAASFHLASSQLAFEFPFSFFKPCCGFIVIEFGLKLLLKKIWTIFPTLTSLTDVVPRSYSLASSKDGMILF